MKKVLWIVLLLFSILPAQNKPRVMWFDATANFKRLSYADSIEYYFRKCKTLGFTDVVIDIKPITGEVLYPSVYAPQMKEWSGFVRSDSLDYLNTCITLAHACGLKVRASLNVFAAGHNFFDRGLVYQDKPHWQCVNYTDSGMVPITKMKHKYSAMTNPCLKEVRAHEIKILEELVSKYPLLDGLILDRVRYDCIEADFSDSSRASFEEFLRLKVAEYPADIYDYQKDKTGHLVRHDGRLYKKWLEWRAYVIYSFIAEAKKAVKKINPGISFGDYTGAWYPLYYEVGVNWASKEYDPSIEHRWATPGYRRFGYAEELDFYTTGCYFYEVTKNEVAELNERDMKRGEAAMGKGKEYWYSVEGSAEIAKKVVMGKVPVIGGLYVEQYSGHPEQFVKAMKMCLEKSDGLMVFDIVHIINNDWWHCLEELDR